MEAEAFDEAEFFRALAQGGARVLLIGRRALIAIGLPVLTADYDLWVHTDDIEALNRAVEPFDLFPNASPETARQRGRYVLENDEHVDVLVARSRSTPDGVRLAFDDAWARRQSIPYRGSTALAIPSLDDLILTKRWALRDKDIADIRLIEGIKRQRESCVAMSREVASPEIANLIAARLSPEEFDRRIRAPLTDGEVEDVAALLAWFSRRYPTAQERLAYARRKVRQYESARRLSAAPAGYRETAQRLARAHHDADPATVGVWIDPDPEERALRLVEVVRSAPTLLQPLAVEFVARPDIGVPFPLTLLLLSPDEWGAVATGKLDLPAPFVATRLEPL